jgi:uncharacterized membrane protein
LFTLSQSFFSTNRVQSIDLVRGVVMVIMALDHTRHFFYHNAASPLDLEATSYLVFFTRWITHFCAPAFILLSGTAACLYGKKHSMKGLSAFLVTRGLWLMFLEVTVIALCWNFSPLFQKIGLKVIWAIGLCLVFMSVIVYLPGKIILIIGIAIIGGHNLLDRYNDVYPTVPGFLWAVAHVHHSFKMLGGRTIAVVYPFFPWLGVMMVGYCIGYLYDSSVIALKRRLILWITGIICCILFVFLRTQNIYGDSHDLTVQASPFNSFLDFINTNKYPPSFLFLLMTLGPVLMGLSIAEKVKDGIGDVITVFGKVPMFFYIGHLFLIHALLLVSFFVTGHSWNELDFLKSREIPSTFGFNIAWVYGVWIAVVMCFYPLCRWYVEYKQKKKNTWWISYL